MSAHEDILTQTTVTCKNCETVFEGGFCPKCSQKANTHRFTLKHFAHEVFHAMTHTDKGILFLIKKLFRWPGIVAREFVGGKRKKYFNPITFLLISIALQIYATKKTDFYPKFLESQRHLLQSIANAGPDKKVPTESLKAIDDAKAQTSKVMEHSRTVTFALLPVLALLTTLFFWKSGFNYTENLVLAIFVQGQMNVMFVLFCIVPILLYPPIVVAILYIYTVIMWAYSMLAYRQFFQQRKWVTLVKGSIVMILYYFVSQQFSKLVMLYL